MGPKLEFKHALSANVCQPNHNATFFTDWSNIMRVSYAYFIFLIIRTPVLYFIIRVWSSFDVHVGPYTEFGPDRLRFAGLTSERLIFRPKKSNI